jgi:hypothetical protein
MGRPAANEMVRLRVTSPFTNGMRWKVTSRFTLQVSARKTLECVRVSSLTGTTIHLSLKEFNRLFRSE